MDQDQVREAIQAMNDRNAQVTKLSETLARYAIVTATSVAIVGFALWIAADCAGMSSCVLIGAAPRSLLERLLLALRIWYWRTRLASAEEELAYMQHALAHLPERIKHHAIWVDSYRIKLIGLHLAAGHAPEDIGRP